MTDDKNHYELSRLIMELIDGSIDNERLKILEEHLANSDEALNYYRDYMKNVAVLKQRIYLLSQNDTECLSPDLWAELAHYEKTAPAVQISPDRSSQQPADEVYHPAKENRQISRFQIFTLVMSASAMILLLLFVNLAPNAAGPVIGKLSRTVDAHWQDASGQIVEGCDLYAGPMSLVRGYAEVILEDGVVVNIQAPCQFTLESSHQIYLQQGKIVALNETQSEDSFLIRTPSASVVDYGTEFGVEVDQSGMTETYVYQGKVQLRDSSNPIKFMKSISLSAGQGAEADTESNLKNTQVDPKTFVRHDEFQTRYLAQSDNGYYRWKASVYRLHRDPCLVAHYFYEKTESNPDKLVNSAFPDAETMQGTFGDDEKGKPTWVQGRWPQKDAVSFERAKHQAIFIPSQKAMCFTKPLTISVWFCFPDSGKWGGHLISSRDNTYINYQFSLFDKNYDYNYQQNRFEFRQYDGVESKVGYYSDTFVPEPGKWYHAAVVYDQTELKFYVNGKLFQRTDYSGILEPVDAEIIIGAIKKGNYVLEKGDFEGVIDELMLFSRGLNEYEIRKIYEDGKP